MLILWALMGYVFLLIEGHAGDVGFIWGVALKANRLKGAYVMCA